MPTTKTKGKHSSGDRDVDGFNEKSSLLITQPSPNSTDSSTKESSSYQAESRKLLELAGSKESSFSDTDESSKLSFFFRKHRNVLLGVAAIAVFALSAFVLPSDAISKVIHPEVPVPFATKTHGSLSKLHPVDDLGLHTFKRPKSSSPPSALTKGAAKNGGRASYPTNAWYQNLLMMDGEPSNIHRAYTVPFVLDAAGPVPGLRVHPNHIKASTAVVQLNLVEAYALTVGAATDATKVHNATETHGYIIENMTPLGVTLGWNAYPMSSSIVKGMPYGTMRYEEMKTSKHGKIMMPTVSSEIPLIGNPIVDGKTELKCQSRKPVLVKVEREVEMHFKSSDFTWLVFFSEPVTIQCIVDEDSGAIQLQVVDSDSDKRTDADDEGASPFFIRIALTKLCTSNMNPIYCHQEQMLPYALNLGQGRYDDLLRNHSHIIPGPNTSFHYAVDDTKQQIELSFDWDARDMTNYGQAANSSTTSDVDLIVFALPHHLDLMGTEKAPGYLKYCASSLIGPACLLAGSTWTMIENLPNIGFRAPRPPAPWAIGPLAKSLNYDIHYTLPDYFQHGIGDTYFSGKMLAKLGRILMVTEEVREICDKATRPRGLNAGTNGYEEVCQNITLPSDDDIADAVATLRSSVEIWINGTGATPFVFDSAWGGVVSCGCDWHEQKCKNKFPECPAFDDPGMNFGNAWYNDLHFHYGYHIYGAAVVANFDPEWGKQMFERVLLLVRNIANPTDDDDVFPAFRHKDWYQGHSWASGIVSPVFLNGRNQESSSEAIAAYESVTLFGEVMMSIWEKEKAKDQMQAAKEVREAGQLLTATEIRSTRRYYHVRDEDNENLALKIYPSEYKRHAVGMLWSTMAQYQTWFGGAPYLAIGIQLIPLTPINEQRDGLQWSMEMYPSLAESCGADQMCIDNGWSVLQLGALATVGHPQLAAKDAQKLGHKVFTSAGGNGHSLSNTLWFLATRPKVDTPLSLHNKTAQGHKTDDGNPEHELTHCFKPTTCTDYVLDTIADEYSCRQRITWLMDTMGHSQNESCYTVAGVQFPDQCGPCNPNSTVSSDVYVAQCPPCTIEQCQSDLNRCPEYPQTFVCTNGPNKGGCKEFPWDVRGNQCDHCCELTECPKTAVEEGNCPPCTRSQCRSSVNKCKEQTLEPFLCAHGPSESGCASQPWPLGNGQCEACCKVVPGCAD